MKRGETSLLQFVAGLALLALGLFIFSQKVVVYTSIFSGFRLGGMNMTSGLLVIPLVIGIVWMFMDFDSIGAKILAVAGVLIILFAVIMSTQIHLTSMTLFDWVLLLVLIFAGLGLTAKNLFTGSGKRESRSGSRKEYSSSLDIEEELDKLKKNR